MNKQKHTVSNAIDTLADDARNLMTATSDVAEEKVVEARKRLADALDRGKEIYSSFREKTVKRVKAFDDAAREHPYQTIALSVGTGVILGYLVARNGSRNH